jgi:hypothetical protein
MFILDSRSEFFPSRIQGQKESGYLIRICIKELSFLTQKIISKLSEIISGMFIPDPVLDFFTHLGSRVKKAPDPGSGSETL